MLDLDGNVINVEKFQSLGDVVLFVKGSNCKLDGPFFMKKGEDVLVLRFVGDCGFIYDIYPSNGVECVGNEILEFLYPMVIWVPC